jgi:effector-binding domain-containing protein
MIEPPQILHTSAQITAGVHVTTPRDEIGRVMGPAIREVYETIAAQGLAPAGPWFTHHSKMTPGIFDFDACVPVTAPVTAIGRVSPGHLPAVKVARTVYEGPYEGLGEAWGEFMEWIEANGLTPADNLWECYLVGPESESDPARYRTELNRPLIG